MFLKRGIAPSLLVLLWMLAGCAQLPSTASTPPTATPSTAVAIAAPPVAARNGGAVASGEVLPMQKAQLGFSTAGRVQRVAVAVGDSVAAGDVLIVLDQAAAQAAVSMARAGLLRAQANVSDLRAGARPQEIAAAQARLDAANARLAQLTEGASNEDVTAAQANLAAAQASLQQLYSGPREADRIAAEAALANAESARQQAQSAYDRVAWRSDVAMLPESARLQQVTNDYNAAKARYDALFAGPDADVVAAARARVQQAQAALDRLLGSATAGQLAEAEAQVRSAQAEVDLLIAGTRDAALLAAVAAVSEAQAAVEAAQAVLDNTELHAPFAGTVTALDLSAGEMVTPGLPVLTLADLAQLQVETIDLSERDVAQITIDQPVTVFVEALNVEIPGRVARIADQADVIGGDVVYPARILLDEQPLGLRWGMSVEVTFQPN